MKFHHPTAIIDPTAIIHPEAKIGAGTTIGAYCIIKENVTLAENCTLHSHITIQGHTKIEKNAQIFPFACIGLQSQDLKFEEGNITYTHIGENVIIREHVTIHSGTNNNTKTTIGNNCVLLTQSHIGHNCIIGDKVIVSHNTALAGHVIVGNHANIGAKSGIHQFCYIGDCAMIGAMTYLTQDVMPFCIVTGNPANIRSINQIGMKRAQFSKEEIDEARQAHQLFFLQNLTSEEALKKIDNLSQNNIIEPIKRFFTHSKRGITR